jgi:hypothetical protein
MLNPNYCRQRAEQCREIAGSILDPAKIEQLILLSVGFDVQAEALELRGLALSEAARLAPAESLGTPTTH